MGRIDGYLISILVAGLLAIGSEANSQIAIGQNAEALSLQGQSGGPVDSKGCGFIASSPNHAINVTDRIDYLRLNLQAEGEPTLLVDGPGGKFCVLADQVSGNNPEISGVWMPGRYSIYVGDRTGSQHQYTINISQQK